jgi:hypothetical protein
MASGEANQECLNQNILQDEYGRLRVPVPGGRTGKFVVKLKLPRTLVCKHCVLQVKLFF